MSLQTEAPFPPADSQVVLPASLWRNRNFILLSVGQVISSIGDFLYSTVLLIWVFSLTRSAAAVSGVWMAQYLAYFLLGPVAGVFVDRWNRRHIMLTADGLRALIALLPLLAPGAFRLALIYLSVFLIAALGRFFLPAQTGVIQVIVAQEQRGRAVSWQQVSLGLAIVAGPGLGSLLYFSAGPVLGILLNAFSFLVSAGCVLGLRLGRGQLQPATGEEGAQQGQERRSLIRGIWQELIEGLSFALRTRVLLVVLLLAIIGMLGGGAVNALDIVFMTQRLHVGAELYGPLATCGGLGLIIGSMLAGLLTTKVSPRRMLPASVLLTGVALVTYALQTWYPAALLLNCIGGITQGGIDVGLMPLVLDNTPPTLIGRVMAMIQTLMFIASALSAALAGALGQLLPAYLVLVSGGILFLLAGAFGWFGLAPRQPDRRPAA